MPSAPSTPIHLGPFTGYYSSYGSLQERRPWKYLLQAKTFKPIPNSSQKDGPALDGCWDASKMFDWIQLPTWQRYGSHSGTNYTCYSHSHKITGGEYKDVRKHNSSFLRGFQTLHVHMYPLPVYRSSKFSEFRFGGVN